MPSLTREDDVFVLDLGESENRRFSAASQAPKGPDVLKTIKQRLYANALSALCSPIDWS
jgi:hypothetical protein